MKISKNGLAVVVFLKSWGVYSTGVTAGFKVKEAQRLRKAGVVRFSDEDAAVDQEEVDEDASVTEETPDDTPDDSGLSLDELPDDWRDSVHHGKLQKLARSLEPDTPIPTKLDAIAVIELKLEEAAK